MTAPSWLEAALNGTAPKPVPVVVKPPAPGAVHAAARAWVEAGCAIVRVRADGTKAPTDKEWESRPIPTLEQVDAWFRNGHPGLGVVCGAVSGNLEMTELEGAGIALGLLDKARPEVPPDLWRRFGTYHEATPGGGLHMLYRVEGIAVPGNVKLARRPATQLELDEWRVIEHRKAAELPEPKRTKRMTFLENLTPEQVPQVLIETRGEGGQVVVAPSGGTVHKTGKAWALLRQSRPGVVGTITAEERELLHKVFESFDLMPKPKPAEPRKPAPPRIEGELRPGDDFEQRADWLDDVLDGWTVDYERGGVTYLTRPGKTFGTSATIGYGETDLLYVFTRSTEFEPEKTYTKFGAYALLNHGGDHAAAAAELRKQGYGGERVRGPQQAAPPPPPAGPGGEWLEPTPLGAPAVPAFPVDALPPVLADWTSATAAATQTPPDLAGLLSLIAVATASAGKYRVGVRTGWSEPLNLYALVSMPPGTKKSAVFKGATSALYEAERLLVEREAEAVRAGQQRHRILEQALRNAEKKAAGNLGNHDARAAAEDAGRELAALVVPTMPRLLVDDVTPEALVSLLADNPCLGLLSEEGGIFGILAGLYSNGVANLDAVLKAWDGGDIRVDRRGSAPRHVKGAALTLGLAVQPSVLASLAKHPDFAGRGLVPRFLFALPDLTGVMGYRQVDAPAVPAAVTAAYDALLRTLALAPRPGAPDELTLSKAAAEVLRAFREQLEPRRNGDTGDLAGVLDWSNKLEGQTVRLAGVLHMARHGAHPPPEVDDTDMAAAVRLAEYVIPHAQAAHDLIAGRPTNGPAQSLLRVVKAKALERFTVRELHRLVGAQNAFRKVGDVEAALAVLVEHGYVRPAAAEAETKGPGRPASPSYVVSPYVVRGVAK